MGAALAIPHLLYSKNVELFIQSTFYRNHHVAEDRMAGKRRSVSAVEIPAKKAKLGSGVKAGKIK